MLTEMLNTAIEIEGLIRILKDGESSAETIALLREKTTALAEKAKEIKEAPDREARTAETPDREARFSETRTEETCGHFGEVALPVADDKDRSENSENSEHSEISDISEISEDSDDILLFTEDDEILKVSEAPDREARFSETRTSAPTDLKKYFSLNDRYLYSRELFGGDMKMFDSTLKFLEGVRDFSDIEDYFYSELEWNPEDPNVASFLDILRPHFSE